MDDKNNLKQLLSASSRQELESTIIYLTKACPLNDAYSRSLLHDTDMEYVMSIISAELNQLKIWLGMDFNLGAFGSTLISEKGFYVFEIAENLSKSGRYQHSAAILCKLLQFGSEISLSNVHCDAEVENLNSQIFRLISNWNRFDIPSDQLHLVLSSLEEYSMLECLTDVGFYRDLKASYSHLVGY
jgi:hypothetical protein